MPSRGARAVYYRELPERRPKPRKRPNIHSRPHIDAGLRFKVAVFFMLAVVTSSITVFRSELNAIRGYQLVQMQQQAARLERENSQLEVQIAQMRAPQRIKSIAINNLGMTVPKEVYFSGEH